MKQLIIICIVIFLYLTGCAPSRTFVDTSCSGYKNIDFNRSKISEYSIGILPVLGGDEKEQFRRPMGDAITKYFREEFGDKNVKSTQQVITILNENELSEQYTKSLTGYYTSGIVPKEVVIKLGKALQVKYLLYTRLLADAETSTLSKIKISELYVQCQVWDTNLGDVVWEGKGGIAKLENDASNLVEKTAFGLSKVVGKDHSEIICLDKSDLVNSVQQAESQGTLLAIIACVGGGLLLGLVIAQSL
ncbi:MAG: hypothetical protein P4L27_05390 [Ignavibacteriaceae bacterium]|nr:hypothetical protein [Ignavibacteriaceae bacterium]